MSLPNVDGMGDNTRIAITEEAAEQLEIPRRVRVKEVREALEKLGMPVEEDGELTEF